MTSAFICSRWKKHEHLRMNEKKAEVLFSWLQQIWPVMQENCFIIERCPGSSTLWAFSSQNKAKHARTILASFLLDMQQSSKKYKAHMLVFYMKLL